MAITSENQPSQQIKASGDIFDKIKDIFEEGIAEKGVEGRYNTISLEFSGFHIDLPKKEKDMYHGSSYEILCNKSKTLCKIKGDLVTEEDYDYEPTKVLEESDCKIFSVHTHATLRKERPYRESHIHFICQDKDRKDTIEMANFLKHY